MDVLKAWDYAQTIFDSEKLQIAYIKAEKIPGNIFVDISKVRKSYRFVLYIYIYMCVYYMYYI